MKIQKRAMSGLDCPFNVRHRHAKQNRIHGRLQQNEACGYDVRRLVEQTEIDSDHGIKHVAWDPANKTAYC